MGLSMYPTNLCSTCGIADFRLTFLWLQLINDVLLVLMRDRHKFRVTSSGHNLIVFVDELDRSECEGFANW